MFSWYKWVHEVVNGEIFRIKLQQKTATIKSLLVEGIDSRSCIFMFEYSTSCPCLVHRPLEASVALVLVYRRCMPLW